MCFHFLIIESSVLPIKFPASFHQISPIVYKASYFTPAKFFLSIESCFFKVVTPLRLVVSFFPDLFPLIFQLNVSTINQFPCITDWFILNEHLSSSFVGITLLLIRSHLSPIWLFNFMSTHSFFRLNEYPFCQVAFCSIGSIFFPDLCFFLLLISGIQISPLIQSSSFVLSGKTSLTIHLTFHSFK